MTTPLLTALKKKLDDIAAMTSPTAESYASDDPQGAIDTVYSVAVEAIDVCEDLARALLAHPSVAPPAPGGDVLADVVRDYLESRDAYDNRELQGVNGEPYEVLRRRLNAARRDLDAALQSTQAPTAAQGPDAAPAERVRDCTTCPMQAILEGCCQATARAKE